MSDTVNVDRLSTPELLRLAAIEDAAAKPGFEFHDEIERRYWLDFKSRPNSTRWVLCVKTSPSGKALFRCRRCLRFSEGPDKACPAGCSSSSEVEV